MTNPDDLNQLLEVRETEAAPAPAENPANVTKPGPLFGWYGEAPRGRPRRRVFWWTVLGVTISCSIPAFIAPIFFFMFPLGLLFCITALLPHSIGRSLSSDAGIYAMAFLWI